jgi:hypothetical protein
LEIDYKKLSDSELLQLYSNLKSDVSKKHNTQMALKILMNAEYGALANRYFRYFDLRLAKSITLTGQLVIQWIEQYLKENLNPLYKVYVIYQDTDSCALSLSHVGKLLKKKFPSATNQEISRKVDSFCEKNISPIIEQGYEALSEKLRCNENKFIMKREKIADRAFFFQKKRYALNVWNNEGVEYSKPKLNITGLEIVRSDTPKKVRNYLKCALNKMILTPDELKDYIKEVKEKFYDLEVEDIAKPSGVKGIKKYSKTTSGLCGKGTPIHVRGAIVYNNYVRNNKIENKFPIVEESSKAKFVYMKTPNIIKGSHVLTFAREFPDKSKLLKYVDYDKMFELTFLNKITGFAEVAGVDMSIDDNKKIDVGDIFG